MSFTKCSDLFALVDCNNFFASCETVFNPRLEEKPLVILSSNDGIIVSRSQKAKKCGIKMGDPAFLHREAARRGDLIMLSSNFSLYADLSRRVMDLLQDFSPHMEIYSIDEAFFLLNERGILDHALAMKKWIRQCTGIPISIGIGPTKTLAKLASDQAKTDPCGVFSLAEPKALEEFLKKTEVQAIWGIGAGSAERLRRGGIHTAFQLQQAEEQKVQSILGICGLRTALELQGIPCLTLNEAQEKNQSIVCSRSFHSAIDSLSLLQEAVAAFAADAAERLRGQASLAGFLSVTLVSCQGSTSCHVHLPVPSAYTPELISLAKEASARIHSSKLIYKKAGVLLGDFCDEESKPLDLFTSDRPSEKKEKAMKTLDEINTHFDKEAVGFAAQGIKKEWKSKPGRVSLKYTTNWADLLRVT